MASHLPVNRTCVSLCRLRDYLSNTTIASICHTLHPVILRHDATVQEALHVRFPPTQMVVSTAHVCVATQRGIAVL